MITRTDVEKLIEDIVKKAEKEARYYQGAIDSLNLLLSNLDKQTDETGRPKPAELDTEF